LTIDNLPEFGFGSQANYNATGEYQTKGILMSTFELGFTFELNEKSGLYTAMFLDSGYGTIIDQSKMNHIGYNPSAVTGRKANGLYSTDKKYCTVKPVAFWSYCLD
jgi:hypothetical protein